MSSELRIKSLHMGAEVEALSEEDRGGEDSKVVPGVEAEYPQKKVRKL